MSWWYDDDGRGAPSARGRITVVVAFALALIAAWKMR